MQQCPYFALTVLKLAVPGTSRPIRIPICRCALTEEAVSRLQTHPEGVELADAFTSKTQQGEQWPLLGPDLEGIAANTCTRTRQTERCCPAFMEMLIPFDLKIDFPSELLPVGDTASMAEGV